MTGAHHLSVQILMLTVIHDYIRIYVYVPLIINGADWLSVELNYYKQCIHSYNSWETPYIIGKIKFTSLQTTGYIHKHCIALASQCIHVIIL